MNIKIRLRHLIIGHISLFVFSFTFMEYSKIFRFNKELHWVYSTGHVYYFTDTLPLALFGSLALAVYSIWKVKENKFLYLIFSILPLILFLIMIYLTY